MKIIEDKILLEELKEIAKNRFGNLVKAVVDIKRKIMAIDGELHADEEALLLEYGSKQEDLWGINIYPEASQNNFIEFDSLINIRPSQGNQIRGIDNPKIREEILAIVNRLIKNEVPT